MKTEILVEYNPRKHTLILTALNQSEIRLLERLASRERGVYVEASGTETLGKVKFKGTLELHFRGMNFL